MDYVVGRDDLNQMIIDWFSAGPDTDIIPDGIVNWLDFTEFADNWLKTDPRYCNPWNFPFFFLILTVFKKQKNICCYRKSRMVYLAAKYMFNRLMK